MHFVKMATDCWTAGVASSGFFYSCCRRGYWNAEEEEEKKTGDEWVSSFLTAHQHSKAISAIHGMNDWLDIK